MTFAEHPSALELSEVDESSPVSAAVLEHIGSCLVCRIQRARLLEDFQSDGEPSPTEIARILEGVRPGPPVLTKLSEQRDQGTPSVGEIWRIGSSQAVLVWVRRVFEDAIDVVPVVFDIEMADQESLLLEALATDFNLPIALLTSVRGHVSASVFLQRVGFANVLEAVQEILSATKQGRMPVGVAIGDPITAPHDSRIAYRQEVAALLLDLEPSRWSEARIRGAPGADKTLDLFGLLRENLPERLDGVAIGPSSAPVANVGMGSRITPCARTTFLDTCVLVVIIEASRRDTGMNLKLAQDCITSIQLEPDADAIALVTPVDYWPTVIHSVPYLRLAFEPPSGSLMPPTQGTASLFVVDALQKFFDSQVTAWEATEHATSVVGDLDIADLALRASEDALTRIADEGRRARAPAKKAAFSEFPTGTAARIAEGMTAIAADEPLEEVLNRLLGGGAP